MDRWLDGNIEIQVLKKFRMWIHYF